MKQEVTSKKVFIRTLGCQMNVRDSEVIAGLLQKEGFRLAKSWEAADIIIFNTCSVRQHAEDKVWSEIGRIALKTGTVLRGGRRQLRKENRPLIGLIGCMAQNYKETAFERSPAIDFVVGPSDIDKIPGIISGFLKKRGQSPKSGDSPLFQSKIWETDAESRPEEIYHTGFYEDKEHAYVVISEGCSNYCSYCVVPYVRGELHNRDYEGILKEIEEAVKNKIHKFTLLGQSVNAYKYNGVNFIKLLKLVNSIKGLEELSFITSHPKDTGLELFEAMAGCKKVRKYLHLPVQSGSDRILKLMNRGYTKEFYLELIRNYRKIVKGGLLSTDVIAGFPTETMEDFKETFSLVKEARFNSAYIFKYSPRPGTQAANLRDDVLRGEKERRHALILKLQKEISKKIQKK